MNSLAFLVLIVLVGSTTARLGEEQDRELYSLKKKICRKKSNVLYKTKTVSFTYWPKIGEIHGGCKCKSLCGGSGTFVKNGDECHCVSCGTNEQPVFANGAPSCECIDGYLHNGSSCVSATTSNVPVVVPPPLGTGCITALLCGSNEEFSCDENSCVCVDGYSRLGSQCVDDNIGHAILPDRITHEPSSAPSPEPSVSPSSKPSTVPTTAPSTTPTKIASAAPTVIPTGVPTAAPSASPSESPSGGPSSAPVSGWGFEEIPSDCEPLEECDWLEEFSCDEQTCVCVSGAERGMDGVCEEFSGGVAVIPSDCDSSVDCGDFGEYFCAEQACICNEGAEQDSDGRCVEATSGSEVLLGDCDALEECGELEEFSCSQQTCVCRSGAERNIEGICEQKAGFAIIPGV